MHCCGPVEDKGRHRHERQINEAPIERGTEPSTNLGSKNVERRSNQMTGDKDRERERDRDRKDPGVLPTRRTKSHDPRQLWSSVVGQPQSSTPVFQRRQHLIDQVKYSIEYQRYRAMVPVRSERKTWMPSTPELGRRQTRQPARSAACRMPTDCEKSSSACNGSYSDGDDDDDDLFTTQFVQWKQRLGLFGVPHCEQSCYETDAQKLDRRRKQVELGKNNDEYRLLTAFVEKMALTSGHSSSAAVSNENRPVMEIVGEPTQKARQQTTDCSKKLKQNHEMQPKAKLQKSPESSADSTKNAVTFRRPTTPNLYQKCSRRSFDAQVKYWKKRVHSAFTAASVMAVVSPTSNAAQN